MNNSPIQQAKPCPEVISPENDPKHTHNFCLAIVYMVCLRIGWILKTESIIMPAVMDLIGGSGWLRGCLPTFNRLGQSIPPMLAADAIRGLRFKKFCLLASTATMGICFLGLSLLWGITQGEKTTWLPIAFLAIYAIFFTATGINQITINTLSGKLIRANRRGSLALRGTVIGASLAVVVAWVLLNLWLGPKNEAPNFTGIFAFTGGMFLLAASFVAWFAERPDTVTSESRLNLRSMFGETATILWKDRNFRTLAIMVGLFGMCLTLFPHYQNLARGRTKLPLTELIPWVIAQNIGAALFSIPTGWIADRFGNRIVLRGSLLLICLPPLLTLLIVEANLDQGWFLVVFWLLGLTPVAIRYFNNYTLEASDRSQHPRYLSTLGLAMALPTIVLSPIVGALIDRVGFQCVFLAVSLLSVVAWLLSFRISEPRTRQVEGGAH